MDLPFAHRAAPSRSLGAGRAERSRPHKADRHGGPSAWGGRQTVRAGSSSRSASRGRRTGQTLSIPERGSSNCSSAATTSKRSATSSRSPTTADLTWRAPSYGITSSSWALRPPASGPSTCERGTARRQRRIKPARLAAVAASDRGVKRSGSVADVRQFRRVERGGPARQKVQRLL
jgi:hypothetical protein